MLILHIESSKLGMASYPNLNSNIIHADTLLTSKLELSALVN